MKRLLMLLLLAFIFIGCEDKITNPEPHTKEIMPLKVGNLWFWDATDYDSLGAVIRMKIDSCGVYNENIWQGAKYYIIIDNWNEKDSDSTVRHIADNYQNNSDGLYSLGFFRINDGHIERDSVAYYLFLKYPGNTGDTYDYLLDAAAKHIKIESNNINYTVKAGTFNCYEYSVNYSIATDTYKEIYYYSPGVGEIYSEKYKRLSSGEFYLMRKKELIRYKIN